MWEWFRKYPSTRIESIGTPYAKGLDLEDVVEYDYIIVGGLFLERRSTRLTFQEALLDALLRID